MTVSCTRLKQHGSDCTVRTTVTVLLAKQSCYESFNLKHTTSTPGSSLNQKLYSHSYILKGKKNNDAYTQSASFGKQHVQRYISTSRRKESKRSTKVTLTSNRAQREHAYKTRRRCVAQSATQKSGMGIQRQSPQQRRTV